MNTWTYHSKSLFFFILILFFSCRPDDSTDIVDPQGPNPDDDIVFVSELSTDVILQWSNLITEIDQYAEGMRPNASARAMAYISLATYEVAAPVLSNYISNDSLLTDFYIFGRPDYENLDVQLALNKAFSLTVDHFITGLPSSERSKITDLESSIALSLGANLSPEQIEASEAWGELVSSQVITYARTDRAAEQQILEPQPASYEPPVGLGFWTYSHPAERALFPYWDEVRTFIISSEETSTVAPLPYSTDTASPYFIEMEEVYTANNSARDNNDEALWIAEFWSDDVTGIMFGPPVRQLAIAIQLIEQYDMFGEDALYMLMKLGFSLNDAAVSTWADKYEYMVMRPSVYIENNIDSDYRTNLFTLTPWPNPTFPAYPSGHSCFASAAAGVFIDFFGNTTDFTDRCHEGRTEFRSTPRSFTTFEQMAEENAFSRIPLGVHMRMDCVEGLRLGYEISDAVNTYNLKQ